MRQDKDTSEPRLKKLKGTLAFLLSREKIPSLLRWPRRRSKSSRLLRNLDSKVSRMSLILLTRTQRSSRRPCKRSKSSSKRSSTRPNRSSRGSKPDHPSLQMWSPPRPRSTLRKSRKLSPLKRKNTSPSTKIWSPNSNWSSPKLKREEGPSLTKLSRLLKSLAKEEASPRLSARSPNEP